MDNQNLENRMVDEDPPIAPVNEMRNRDGQNFIQRNNSFPNGQRSQINNGQGPRPPSNVGNGLRFQVFNQNLSGGYGRNFGNNSVPSRNVGSNPFPYLNYNINPIQPTTMMNFRTNQTQQSSNVRLQVPNSPFFKQGGDGGARIPLSMPLPIRPIRKRPIQDCIDCGDYLSQYEPELDVGRGSVLIRGSNCSVNVRIFRTIFFYNAGKDEKVLKKHVKKLQEQTINRRKTANKPFLLFPSQVPLPPFTPMENTIEKREIEVLRERTDGNGKILILSIPTKKFPQFDWGGGYIITKFCRIYKRTKNIRRHRLFRKNVKENSFHHYSWPCKDHFLFNDGKFVKLNRHICRLVPVSKTTIPPRTQKEAPPPPPPPTSNNSPDTDNFTPIPEMASSYSPTFKMKRRNKKRPGYETDRQYRLRMDNLNGNLRASNGAKEIPVSTSKEFIVFLEDRKNYVIGFTFFFEYNSGTFHPKGRKVKSNDDNNSRRRRRKKKKKKQPSSSSSTTTTSSFMNPPSLPPLDMIPPSVTTTTTTTTTISHPSETTKQQQQQQPNLSLFQEGPMNMRFPPQMINPPPPPLSEQEQVDSKIKRRTRPIRSGGIDEILSPEPPPPSIHNNNTTTTTTRDNNSVGGGINSKIPILPFSITSSYKFTNYGYTTKVDLTPAGGGTSIVHPPPPPPPPLSISTKLQKPPPPSSNGIIEKNAFLSGDGGGVKQMKNKSFVNNNNNNNNNSNNTVTSSSTTFKEPVGKEGFRSDEQMEFFRCRTFNFGVVGEKKFREIFLPCFQFGMRHSEEKEGINIFQEFRSIFEPLLDVSSFAKERDMKVHANLLGISPDRRRRKKKTQRQSKNNENENGSNGLAPPNLGKDDEVLGTGLASKKKVAEIPDPTPVVVGEKRGDDDDDQSPLPQVLKGNEIVQPSSEEQVKENNETIILGKRKRIMDRVDDEEDVALFSDPKDEVSPPAVKKRKFEEQKTE